MAGRKNEKNSLLSDRRTAHLQSLVEASKLLNSTLDLGQLLEIILSIALKNTEAEAGTIYLIDKKSNTIWSKVSDLEKKIEVRLPMGQGIAGHVAQSGETINIRDAYTHPQFTSKFDQITGFRTKSILCMPMRDENKTIIGVFQLINKQAGIFTSEDELFLMDLSVHAALAIRQTELHKEALEKKAISCEIAIARNIQNFLLPKSLPEVKGYEFAATNLPSEVVSGDYYDFIIHHREKICFVIGDVAGKGIPAALMMASLRTAMHAQALVDVEMTPELFLTRVNQMIYESSPHNKFITLFYGELYPESGRIVFVNAGHNPPFHVDMSGQLHPLQTNSLPLGVKVDSEYRSAEMILKKGEHLFLYTDGVTEAMDSQDHEFGEETLIDILKQMKQNETAEELMNRVVESIQHFRGDTIQNDDLTMAVVMRQ
ncbi:SpoIIE family protein phosphatase [candidate division KSB1 bacterium]|nr:SpoIIE family protein phosphatase [candidate division KSB1 bacterium]